LCFRKCRTRGGKSGNSPRNDGTEIRFACSSPNLVARGTRAIFDPVFHPAQVGSTLMFWNLIHSIKTMNWTRFQTSPKLTSEQIAILTTPGPNEHPHSALLPPKFQALRYV